MIKVIEAITTKQVAIEEIKSHHAVLRNSINYLPLVVENFISGLNAAERNSGISHAAHSLLHHLLSVSINNHAEHLHGAHQAIDMLRAKQNILEQASLQQLQSLLTHAGIVIEYKGDVDNQLAGAERVPLEQNIDRIHVTYQRTIKAVKPRRTHTGRCSSAQPPCFLSVLSLSLCDCGAPPVR